MIDMRRQHNRRRSERPFHAVVTWMLLLAIIGAAAWGGWEAGKYRIISTTVKELQSDLVVAKAINVARYHRTGRK
jgi:hypothetical protein